MWAWPAFTERRVSGFIDVASGIDTAFLLVAKQYSLVWIHHIFCIHLSVGRCWVAFTFWLMNNAAMNMYVTRADPPGFGTC